MPPAVVCACKQGWATGGPGAPACSLAEYAPLTGWREKGTRALKAKEGVPTRSTSVSPATQLPRAKRGLQGCPHAKEGTGPAPPDSHEPHQQTEAQGNIPPGRGLKNQSSLTWRPRPLLKPSAPL